MGSQTPNAGNLTAVMVQFKQELKDIQTLFENQMKNFFQKFFEEEMEVYFTGKEQNKAETFKMESSEIETDVVMAGSVLQNEGYQRGLTFKIGTFVENIKIGDTGEDLFFSGIPTLGLYFPTSRIKIEGFSFVGKVSSSQREWKKYKKKKEGGGALKNMSDI